MKTGFKDRAGKDIHTGDLVQYRLSNLKQGPITLKVTRDKNGRFKLVDPRINTNKGLTLSRAYEKYIVIINTSAREE